MKLANLQQAKTPELVKVFADLAEQRGMAVLDSDTRRANKLFDEMKNIDGILRERGKQARLTLTPLMGSDNRFVRYYAAKYLLGLLPDQARRVIEEIATPNFDALGGDAGMTLWALDKAISQPD